MPGPIVAPLTDRAVINVAGPDWRGFLQGLLTQDVETLAEGELRFGALLTPQGRLLFDLFILATADGCRLDCAADRTEALADRLALYRLRAKVTVTPADGPVFALWDAQRAPGGWIADPRLPALGFRAYGGPPEAPAGAVTSELAAYEAHRLALGVPGAGDWGFDRTYPIEADFDLLGGIDFRKGCFVGQETTSRMKRRGAVKTRMAPIAYDGPPPAFGAELLAGSLRAGETLSGGEGGAMASLRLDRLDAGERRLPDGRAWRPLIPTWFPAT